MSSKHFLECVMVSIEVCDMVRILRISFAHTSLIYHSQLFAMGDKGGRQAGLPNLTSGLNLWKLRDEGLEELLSVIGEVRFEAPFLLD